MSHNACGVREELWESILSLLETELVLASLYHKSMPAMPVNKLATLIVIDLASYDTIFFTILCIHKINSDYFALYPLLSPSCVKTCLLIPTVSFPIFMTLFHLTSAIYVH